MSQAYADHRPTVFDQHLEIDYEPSDALFAAREAAVRAYGIYEEAQDRADSHERLEYDSQGWDELLRIRREAWEAASAEEKRLEADESRENWLVVPVARNRDSGPLDESNFEAALEMLGGESETVEVHRFGHWGPGWYEIIIAHPSLASKVDTIHDRLENTCHHRFIHNVWTPALDEEDLSRRESEALDEDWVNWGRRDFEKSVMSSMESLVNDMDIDETDVEREFRELSDRYLFDSDGIQYDISGKPIPTPFDVAWERKEHIDCKWESKHWDALFNELNDDGYDFRKEYTGTESIFKYDAAGAAQYALDNLLELETKNEAI